MMNGYYRVAAANIDVRLADPAANADSIQDAARGAAGKGARLIVFPELCLTGATCGNLFFDDKLQSSATEQLMRLVRDSIGRTEIVVVGLPIEYEGGLYSAAAVYSDGCLHGLVPKAVIEPGDGLGQQRYFRPGPDIPAYVTLRGAEGAAGMTGAAGAGDELSQDYSFDFDPDMEFGIVDSTFEDIQFCPDLLLRCEENRDLSIAVVIGDIGAGARHSRCITQAGALIIANPCACAEALGRPQSRRMTARSLTAATACGVVTSAAGPSESTTDMVFSGHCIIAESGSILAESEPLAGPQIVIADIDIQSLHRDRLCSAAGAPAEPPEEVTFSQPEHDAGFVLSNVIPFDRSGNESAPKLYRDVRPYPFLPERDEDRKDYCMQVLYMQSEALRRRLLHTGSKCFVIGVSGGLDSTLALIVSKRAAKLTGGKASVMAVTLPGAGTSDATKDLAHRLCAALDIELREIDIEENFKTHLRAIGHEESDHTVVYENAQARIRSIMLMDLANKHSGIMVGTGDMSELALGWTTYGGDHMSMYGVNAGVPKTLIKYVLRFIADNHAEDNPGLSSVLLDILDSPISPELLPPGSEGISQKTEEIIGPYELHDFFLYHMLRHGKAPSTLLALAEIAFPEYGREQILTCLKTFYKRFFRNQFKRSAVPDGPMILPISLSPRSAWAMPSDADATIWLRELDACE